MRTGSGRAYGPDNSRTALAGALAGDADGLESDAALLRRVVALGVDAVTTDDPAALRARLAVAA
jgi:glycerophosphoryl diester phosphodiesterase